MPYPKLVVDTKKLAHNTRTLAERCAARGIALAAVTKVYCAFPELARVQAASGVAWLADSRVENLAKLQDIPLPKILLRLPMISQAEDVVALADLSFNSEIATCKALAAAARKQGKIHDVLLMVDLGDLREGVWADRAVETAGEILALEGVRLRGVGVNLTCYGGVLPSSANMTRLVEIAEAIEKRYGVALEIVSGGNSSSLKLLASGGMPSRINHLRLGESVVLGFETAEGTRIPGTVDDVFTFAAEIVELQTKPSLPVGEIGRDAFGQVPVFEDRGWRRRAIVAAGRQDLRIDAMRPRDEKISILGASSDHMILDVTDSSREWQVGDAVEFNLAYGALLAAATSAYVTKEFV